MIFDVIFYIGRGLMVGAMVGGVVGYVAYHFVIHTSNRKLDKLTAEARKGNGRSVAAIQTLLKNSPQDSAILAALEAEIEDA